VCGTEPADTPICSISGLLLCRAMPPDQVDAWAAARVAYSDNSASANYSAE